MIFYMMQNLHHIKYTVGERDSRIKFEDDMNRDGHSRALTRESLFFISLLFS